VVLERKKGRKEWKLTQLIVEVDWMNVDRCS